MKLFENGVGRPTNEIIKKRRIFVLSISAFVIIIMMCLVGVLTSYDSNKLKGEVSDCDVWIVGTNGKIVDSFIITEGNTLRGLKVDTSCKLSNGKKAYVTIASENLSIIQIMKYGDNTVSNNNWGLWAKKAGSINIRVASQSSNKASAPIALKKYKVEVINSGNSNETIIRNKQPDKTTTTVKSVETDNNTKNIETKNSNENADVKNDNTKNETVKVNREEIKIEDDKKYNKARATDEFLAINDYTTIKPKLVKRVKFNGSGYYAQGSTTYVDSNKKTHYFIYFDSGVKDKIKFNHLSDDGKTTQIDSDITYKDKGKRTVANTITVNSLLYDVNTGKGYQITNGHGNDLVFVGNNLLVVTNSSCSGKAAYDYSNNYNYNSKVKESYSCSFIENDKYYFGDSRGVYSYVFSKLKSSGTYKNGSNLPSPSLTMKDLKDQKKPVNNYDANIILKGESKHNILSIDYDEVNDLYYVLRSTTIMSIAKLENGVLNIVGNYNSKTKLYDYDVKTQLLGDVYVNDRKNNVGVATQGISYYNGYLYRAYHVYNTSVSPQMKDAYVYVYNAKIYRSTDGKYIKDDNYGKLVGKFKINVSGELEAISVNENGIYLTSTNGRNDVSVYKIETNTKTNLMEKIINKETEFTGEELSYFAAKKYTGKNCNSKCISKNSLSNTTLTVSGEKATMNYYYILPPYLDNYNTITLNYEISNTKENRTSSYGFAISNNRGLTQAQIYEKAGQAKLNSLNGTYTINNINTRFPVDKKNKVLILRAVNRSKNNDTNLTIKSIKFSD